MKPRLGSHVSRAAGGMGCEGLDIPQACSRERTCQHVEKRETPMIHVHASGYASH